ncbi:predicted protein [Postia placenta Mad-698-R]|uniref:Uncharacterized protein n=1 Tax=Postia placenta MAD-698-R-SB12 TaxID=670580 RepID=A0A1X6N6D1_9APHY|nr:hypothetical protein POSPLADRAFT_1045183 [Postia placenta MAD-698-R-SB12]EED78970.1 predicted protein [Postia placenta Mad-698-R]OSX64052.1 hypothetical protein POSPLADRAFT_1045183 [Postia placenta MAD-698-R-SB12]
MPIPWFLLQGRPQVGNQAFANYVDQQPTSVTHINHEGDPISICPGMFLGFVHPSGEVHIEDSGEWAACPGQDNPSTQCIGCRDGNGVLDPAQVTVAIIVFLLLQDIPADLILIPVRGLSVTPARYHE